MSGTALAVAAVLPELTGDEESVDRTHLGAVAHIVLSVGVESALGLPDLAEQPLHHLPLLGELLVGDGTLCVVDELLQSGLVGVTCIDKRLDDLLLKLVVKVLLVVEEVLGGGVSSDDDTLQVHQVVQEASGAVVCDFLEELVSGDFDKPLETDGRLTSLVVLRGDHGLEVLEHLDLGSGQHTDGGLLPVHDQQSVELLVHQHTVEGLREECGVAAVEEGGDGLRGIDDVLDHLGLVSGAGDLSAEDDDSLLGDLVIRLKTGHDGVDGAGDVLECGLRFDVLGLALLVSEIGHGIRN